MSAPVTIGVDLGTTTITALALEEDRVLASLTVAGDADATSEGDKALGRSESDPHRIALRALHCLRGVVLALGERSKEVSGIGITGQQHGVLILDGRRAITPFIDWRDRRGDEPFPGLSWSFAEQAARIVGEEARVRAGCRLASGHLGTTLFWMKSRGLLPASGKACFIGGYLGSVLTETPPVSDPTFAASSGVFDVRRRRWDDSSIKALGLPASLFPEIREATEVSGALSPAVAGSIGLTRGIPVFTALGDCQAAFLGSTRGREDDVLINVGTGAQVAARIGDFLHATPLECRPLPRSGHLIVGVQPGGGMTLALLEGFFREVRRRFGGVEGEERLFEKMNELAGSVPPGADGLRYAPLLGSWTGSTPRNFTPAHMTRAVMEGIAESLHEDYLLVARAAGRTIRGLVGGGNGLRRNPALREIIAGTFGMPVDLPRHPEEAAVGAAVCAARGNLIQ